MDFFCFIFGLFYIFCDDFGLRYNRVVVNFRVIISYSLCIGVLDLSFKSYVILNIWVVLFDSFNFYFSYEILEI